MFVDLFFPDPGISSFQTIGSSSGNGTLYDPGGGVGSYTPVSGSTPITFNPGLYDLTGYGYYGSDVYLGIASIRGMPGTYYSPVMRDRYVSYSFGTIMTGSQPAVFPYKILTDFIDSYSGQPVPFAPAIDYEAQRVQAGDPITGSPEIQRITLPPDYYPKRIDYNFPLGPDGFRMNIGASFTDLPTDDNSTYIYNYAKIAGSSSPWAATVGFNQFSGGLFAGGINLVGNVFIRDGRLDSQHRWDGQDGFNPGYGFDVSFADKVQLSASNCWRNLVYNGLACYAHRLRGNASVAVTPIDFLEGGIDGMIFKGSLSAETSPNFANYPTATRGDVYRVYGPGILADKYFKDLDYLICIADTPAGGREVEGNWMVTRPIENIVEAYAESPSSILVVINPTPALWNLFGGSIPLIRGKCGQFKMELDNPTYLSGLGSAGYQIEFDSLLLTGGSGAVVGPDTGIPGSGGGVGEFNADSFNPSFTVSDSGRNDPILPDPPNPNRDEEFHSAWDWSISAAFS